MDVVGIIFLVGLACGMFFAAYRASRQGGGAFAVILCAAVGTSCLLWAAGVFKPESGP